MREAAKRLDDVIADPFRGLAAGWLASGLELPTLVLFACLVDLAALMALAVGIASLSAPIPIALAATLVAFRGPDLQAAATSAWRARRFPDANPRHVALAAGFRDMGLKTRMGALALLAVTAALTGIAASGYADGLARHAARLGVGDGASDAWRLATLPASVAGEIFRRYVESAVPKGITA